MTWEEKTDGGCGHEHVVAAVPGDMRGEAAAGPHASASREPRAEGRVTDAGARFGQKRAFPHLGGEEPGTRIGDNTSGVATCGEQLRREVVKAVLLGAGHLQRAEQRHSHSDMRDSGSDAVRRHGTDQRRRDVDACLRQSWHQGTRRTPRHARTNGGSGTSVPGTPAALSRGSNPTAAARLPTPTGPRAARRRPRPLRPGGWPSRCGKTADRLPRCGRDVGDVHHHLSLPPGLVETVACDHVHAVTA